MFQYFKLVTGERGFEAVRESNEEFFARNRRGSCHHTDSAARMNKRVVRSTNFNERDNLRSREDIVWLVRHEHSFSESWTISEIPDALTSVSFALCAIFAVKNEFACFPPSPATARQVCVSRLILFVLFAPFCGQTHHWLEFAPGPRHAVRNL